MKKKFNNKFGIVFFVTGLSGAGKTVFSKKIHKFIEKKYGKTLVISGDEIRNSFNFKKYSKHERIKLGIQIANFIKIISKQKINIIYNAIAMFKEIRKQHRKNFVNYVEVYLKTDLKKAAQNKNKIYQNKKKDIIGKDIKPDYPKNSNIVIKNSENKTLESLKKDFVKKFDKIYT
jgi:adenylylsulfate kinase-like enzyme